MLGLADSLKQTRFYQEGKEEGIEELVLRQLTRRVGAVSSKLKAQVEALSIEQLGELGEALLDFSEMADLLRWLETHAAEA